MLIWDLKFYAPAAGSGTLIWVHGTFPPQKPFHKYPLLKVYQPKRSIWNFCFRIYSYPFSENALIPQSHLTGLIIFIVILSSFVCNRNILKTSPLLPRDLRKWCSTGRGQKPQSEKISVRGVSPPPPGPPRTRFSQKVSRTFLNGQVIRKMAFFGQKTLSLGYF